MSRRGSIIVVHAGALGDSVLLWPALRSMAAKYDRVTLVSQESKARLASRFLGIEWDSIERERWRNLWIPGTQIGDLHYSARSPTHRDSAGDVQRVLSLVADGANGVWAHNARAAYPDASVEVIERRLDRTLAIELAELEGGAGLVVPLRRNTSGPVVMHAGSGGGAKRWPMHEWENLAADLVGFFRIRVIAGEVEREQFSESDRAAFARLRGDFLEDLDALADVLIGSRLFVGCDSGPAHLAAQLGVPTVAIFTVTEPNEWGPVGPAVRVVRTAQRAAAMSDSVGESCFAMLAD